MLSWLNDIIINITRPIVSITSPIINPIKNVLQSFRYVVDILILSQFIRNISLLEAMIVSDGVYTAIKFTKEYLYYKIRASIKQEVDINADKEIELSKNDKKQLIYHYNRLYHLNIIDRYILYGLLYIISIILWTFIKWQFILCNMSNDISNLIYGYLYILILSFTIPYIQNYILEIEPNNKWINYYLQNKNIFIRYSCSKTVIHYIKNLNSGINTIKNYQIFMLYRYLSFNMFIDFFKSYCFIYLLYFLRNNDKTYYYYKAVKLAYYYSTGYLFNIISIEDSVYIINIIITEKRWNDLSKLEIVHAFYTLIEHKYNKDDDMYISLSLHLAKFCTLWSFICLLKILTIKMNTIILLCLFIVDYKLNNKEITKNKNFIERFGIIIITYCLLLLNTNDLIISAIFVLYRFIYLICNEIVFFINNRLDIKKILDFYQEKSVKTLKMKTQQLNLTNIKNNKNEKIITEYVVIS